MQRTLQPVPTVAASVGMMIEHLQQNPLEDSVRNDLALTLLKCLLALVSSAESPASEAGWSQLASHVVDLPKEVSVRLSAELTDLDRGELILRLEQEGYPQELLCAQLGFGIRRLRGLRALANEPPARKQLIRKYGITETQRRALINHPKHVSIDRLLELVGRYQPTISVIGRWVKALEVPTGLCPERVLKRLCKP